MNVQAIFMGWAAPLPIPPSVDVPPGNDAPAPLSWVKGEGRLLDLARLRGRLASVLAGRYRL